MLIIYKYLKYLKMSNFNRNIMILSMTISFSILFGETYQEFLDSEASKVEKAHVFSEEGNWPIYKNKDLLIKK